MYYYNFDNIDYFHYNSGLFDPNYKQTHFKLIRNCKCINIENEIVYWCIVRFAEDHIYMLLNYTEQKYKHNSSGGHSSSQHSNCTLLQNVRHLWHCAVW